MQIACYSNSGHFKFDMMLMIGCLLLATRLVNFWQHSGLHSIDIPVDLFPVYSTSTLITANQMNLCSKIPHFCTISILNRSTRFKDFHGSNRLTYLYIYSLSNQIQVPTSLIAHHTSHVGGVMLMLDGRAEGFVAIFAISGII